VKKSSNLDLVRSIYAAWERGDFHSIEWAHPEIEYVIADGPHPGTWRGISAVEETQREVLSAWASWRVDVQSYRKLDGERVFVLSRVTGRGATSGLQLEQKRAAVFHVRGERVIRHVVWWDRDRALADLGLEHEVNADSSSEDRD
jgi:ketosteroid isomerase-like protein